MISGKHSFGNGFDVRFSYMDADELECPNGVCGEPGFYGEYNGFGSEPASNTAEADARFQQRLDNNTFSEQDTDAQAYNIGLFYTMPAGTELRATYSKVDNENNSGYDFGIGGTNVWNVTDDDKDEDIEMFAIGIVHWFD